MLCEGEILHTVFLSAAVRLHNHTAPGRTHTPKLKFNHVQYHCTLNCMCYNVNSSIVELFYCYFTDIHNDRANAHANETCDASSETKTVSECMNE